MNCPKCDKETDSSVVSLGCRVTLVTYYNHSDKKGNHYHDPNIRQCDYRCSEGHEFTIKSRTKCPNPNCDYGGIIDD